MVYKVIRTGAFGITKLRLAALVLALLFCETGLSVENAATLAAPSPERLSRVESGNEATVFIDHKNRTLRFTVTASRGPQGDSRPMTERLNLCQPLIKQALDAEAGTKPFRLMVGKYAELNLRIATAAAKSGGWDLKKGKPYREDADEFVRKLILKGLTPELTEFFEALGFVVGIDSVESVTICRVSEFKENFQPPLSPDGLLPCGAAILFTLKRK